MKFYNRKNELARLSKIASLSAETSHMVVITGRRRIGKTELIRQFSRDRRDILYLFVSKKKPQILLDEFRDLLSEKIPMAKNVTFRSFDDYFSFLFSYMKEKYLIVVLDEFQNFEFLDPSVFSVLQKLWDKEKDDIQGAFVFVGSVFTLMKRIFEGKKEPLFGRATSKLYIEPLDPDAVAEILSDHNLSAETHLPFYFTLFGGIPRYYFLSDRYQLFGKSHREIIRKLFCEKDAPLQNEGKELLIEEFGKNYHLYFSILQVIAGGETQMSRIADGCGINVNSISKYLDELISHYQVLERRIPLAEFKPETKRGRYYIKDPALRFWFRYIFKNQSLIEIGDEMGLTMKILNDLTNFLGHSFEELVKELLIKRNLEGALPFRFTRIGSYWSRKGDVEIDIVAVNDEEGKILFGECKLKGGRFATGEALKFRAKAAQVKWKSGKREEYFALFSPDRLPEFRRAALEREGILCHSLKELIGNPLKPPL